MRKIRRLVFILSVMLALGTQAMAMDYTFKDVREAEYYGSTSYEDVYGAQYNYGGTNAVDFLDPLAEGKGYGLMTTTGVSAVTGTDAGYGLSGGYGLSYDSSGGYPDFWGTPANSVQQTKYTSASSMKRSDGSIGTLKIPTLDISMKVWEGETNASMSKGLGHYSSTSAWGGNIGVCGHNRGAKYTIGSIKNLEIGDVIKYTTVYGERVYQVSFVGTISSDDWSYLQATTDNRITLTTCLANQPDMRVCVQAREVRS